LTNGENAQNPVWSRDRRLVIFQLPGGLFWTRADGAGKPEPLMQNKRFFYFPSSFTPDGTQLESLSKEM